LVLIDTSAWIDFLNGTGSKADAAIQGLIADEEPIAVCPQVIMEFLQGFRSDRQFDKAKKTLLPLARVSPSDPDTYINAAKLYRLCRKKGKTVTPSDCLIAVIAIENDLPLVHNDADFKAIAAVSGKLKLYDLSQSA
jgi:hypothetical protein